jgi:ATP/maltotriose-dependent transcriptional regulator MalT
VKPTTAAAFHPGKERLAQPPRPYRRAPRHLLIDRLNSPLHPRLDLLRHEGGGFGKTGPQAVQGGGVDLEV